MMAPVKKSRRLRVAMRTSALSIFRRLLNSLLSGTPRSVLLSGTPRSVLLSGTPRSVILSGTPRTAASQEKPFILLCRTRALWELQAILALLVLTLLSRFSVLANLSTHVLGGAERDAALYLWLIEQNQKNLFSEPWFSTSAFYPYTLSLGWSDNFILPSLLSWPFMALGASLTASYNCLLLGAQFLNGYGTYRLAHALCGNRSAAFLGGAAFLLCPALSAHLGHPQLQFFFFIPFAVFAFFKALSQPTFVRGLLVGLTVAGAFLTTVYYAVFIGLSLLVILALLFALRPAEVLRLRPIPGIAGCAAGLLPLLPFIGPYLAVQSTFGERLLHEPYFFSATALSYLSASPFSFLMDGTASFSHSEAQLYSSIALIVLFVAGLVRALSSKHLLTPTMALLGSLFFTAVSSIPSLTPLSTITTDFMCAVGTWVTMGALLWWLLTLGRLERISSIRLLSNRALLALCAGVVIVLFLISLGPRGYSEAGPAIALYRACYELVPGFSAARAVGRLGIVVVFFLYLGAALSYAYLQRSAKLPAGIFVIVLGVATLEGAIKVYPLEEPPARPAIFDQISSLSRNGDVMVVLPFSGPLTEERHIKSWSEFARLQVNAMRWALPTNVKVVNGYSGQRTKLMRDWPARLSPFPSSDALRSLSEIAGLRFVVVLRREMSEIAFSTLKDRIGEFGSSLSVLSSDKEGNLLLEYRGSRVMDTDGAVLLAPRYPRGVLTVELSVVPNAGVTELPIIVRDLDKPEAPPLAQFSFPANGSWHEKSFRIGDDAYAVSPLRIGISVSGNFPLQRAVYLRRSSYEAGAISLASISNGIPKGSVRLR